MPRMKMLTSMAGVHFVHNRGDVIECTDAEAGRYAAAGIAERVDDEPTPVERAVKVQRAEKAVRKG